MISRLRALGKTELIYMLIWDIGQQTLFVQG